ncbi:hypothetical protein CDEST_15077 [Colletotrichum destructivum]|uniref:Uncharacterized protein n=1 Tax=Colletotrichum destructivum TaxID=34406 RepID=A0AAX4J3W4_9PEZI|nr:hypothetical protein CDEST_15077 [Colletotrichum destructivum]
MRLADWTNALGETENSVVCLLLAGFPPWARDDDSPDFESHGGPSRTLLLGRAGLSVPTQPQVSLFSAAMRHISCVLSSSSSSSSCSPASTLDSIAPWPRLNLAWNGLRP